MKQIEQLLMGLHEKKAFVNSAGLTSESSIEVGVVLVYKEYTGLKLITTTKYNSSSIYEALLERVNKVCNEKAFNYDTRNTFQDMVKEYSEESFVTVGRISPYGIIRSEVEYDDTKEGDIRQVILHYKEGGSVKIRILKK